MRPQKKTQRQGYEAKSIFKAEDKHFSHSQKEEQLSLYKTKKSSNLHKTKNCCSVIVSKMPNLSLTNAKPYHEPPPVEELPKFYNRISLLKPRDSEDVVSIT